MAEADAGKGVHQQVENRVTHQAVIAAAVACQVAAGTATDAAGLTSSQIPAAAVAASCKTVDSCSMGNHCCGSTTSALHLELCIYHAPGDYQGTHMQLTGLYISHNFVQDAR